MQDAQRFIYWYTRFEKCSVHVLVQRCQWRSCVQFTGQRAERETSVHVIGVYWIYLLDHCNRLHSSPPVWCHRLVCSQAHGVWSLHLGFVMLATVSWLTVFSGCSFSDFHVKFGRWSFWLHRRCCNRTKYVRKRKKEKKISIFIEK